MTIALILWVLFIGFEVWWNLWLIRNQHAVDHAQQLFIRVVVGAALWILTAIFADIEADQWLAQPLALALSFWFLFDSLMGLALKRDVTFLGTTARLDRLQRKAPLIVVWWFKLLLAVGSVLIYYYGFGKVLAY